MKLKNKIIISLIIICNIIIIFLCNKSIARSKLIEDDANLWSLGWENQTITLGYPNLENSDGYKNLFCIESRQRIWSRDDGTSGLNYQLVDHITINNRVARSSRTGNETEHLSNLELAYAIAAPKRNEKNTYPRYNWDNVNNKWQATESEGVGFSDDEYLLGRTAKPTHDGDNALQTFIWGWFPWWYDSDGLMMGQRLTGKEIGVVSEWDGWATQKFTGRFVYLRDSIVVPEVAAINNEIQNQTEITDGTSNPSVLNQIQTVNGKQYIQVGPFTVANVQSGGVTDFIVRNQNNQPINGALIYSQGQYASASGAVSIIASNTAFHILIPVDSGATYLSNITLTKLIKKYDIKAEIYLLQSRSDTWQNLMVCNGTYDEEENSPSTVTFTYNIALTGNINLKKIDANKGNPMVGVGFKFKNTNNGQWVQNISGKIAYTENENSATVFYTNNNGELTVKGVLVGSYEAKEVILSDTDIRYYDLRILNANFTVSPGDTTTVNVTVENVRKYIDLSGKVWEEMEYVTKGYKENSYENLYSSEDKQMGNVKVYLRKTDSNTDYKEPVYTNEEGYYEFTKVEIDDLPSLYIEFEYNGMVYESVPVVDLTNENSSKSAENLREEFNEKFTQIEEGRAVNGDIKLTYDTEQNTNEGEEEQKSTIDYGDELRYGWQDDKNSGNPRDTNSPVYGGDSNYWTTANTYEVEEKYIGQVESYTPTEIRDNGTTMIGNLNLGLKRREQPDLAVSNELYSAKLTVPTTEGTETHIYNYSDRNNKNLLADIEQGITNPAVQWGRLNLPTSYTRPLYASDIAKGTEEGNFSLYVTYKLSIINQSTSLIASIDTIKDYFNTKYEIDGFTIGKTIDENSNIENFIRPVGATRIQGTEYNKIEEIEINEQIAPNTSTEIYLQFKVKDSEIVKLIGIGTQYEEVVQLDNIVEITKYSTMSRDGAAYAGIDKDSEPGNFKFEQSVRDLASYVENMSNYEDDTSRAPGLKLVLGDERTTAGTVFLDETVEELTTGNAREGDGVYNSGEPGINNVQVTMYEVDESGNKTNVAQCFNSETKQWENAQMETSTAEGQDGGYKFSGYIPGNYIIEYDWGGEKVTTSKGEEITLKVQDYKSTIVDETRWNNKQSNDKWYITENTEENRYSDAVDNYTTRQTIDGQTSKLTYGLKEEINAAYQEGYTRNAIDTTMDSYTPKFRVSVEYDPDDDKQTNLADIYELNENGTPKIENGNLVAKDGYKNELKNIDFGIVERARQELKLDKYISTARLTLANGTILVDANLDENGNIVNQDEVKYAVGVPETSITRKLLRIEIDDELVQGATLNLQYSYKITNQSELDYTTQEFYMYGNNCNANYKQETQLVQLTPSIIDYLDNDLAINQSSFTGNGWGLLTDTDKQNYTTEGINQYITEDIKTDNYIANIQNVAINESNSVLQNMIPGQAREIQLDGSRIVSTTTDGTQIDNDAEIIIVEKTGGSTLTTIPGNYVPRNWNQQNGSEVDDSRVDLTIIPPTGETTNTIAYIILGISSLGIVIAGIVMIKKFVLQN